MGPKCFGQLPVNWSNPAYACGLCHARAGCTDYTATIRGVYDATLGKIAAKDATEAEADASKPLRFPVYPSYKPLLRGWSGMPRSDSTVDRDPKKVISPGTIKWTPDPREEFANATRTAPPEAPKSDIDAILDERGKRYGKFTDHADISQDFKHRMQGCSSWPKLAPDQREALEMIAHKVARILNGDPNYADSWVDIAGYAQLVSDRLEGKAR